MVLDVFLSWSIVSAGHSDLGSNISAKEDPTELALFQDKGLGYDALLSRHGGVAESP